MLSMETHRLGDGGFVVPPVKKIKHDLATEGSLPAHSDKGRESAEELLRRRKRHVAAPQGTGLHFPESNLLQVVRGEKQYVFDKNGRRLLDTVNNVPHVGHCHPEVVAAAAAQMAELNTNSRFLNDRMVTYAKNLTATFPEKLNVCFFTNSGSEANDLALQIAEAVTGNTETISLHGCYHGHLKSLRQLSTHHFAKGAHPSFSECIAPMPDVYRGRYQNPETAGELYAEEIQKIIEQQHTKNKGIAGFIHEPILCCGGVVFTPDGFLEAAYRKVRDAGGLCIADEIQSGFGRVGKHFWAFELQGVCPDIVTVGKPMGNGHPVGAVITSREIADKFAASGTEYFNTFGGNPVSMAICDTVLKVMNEEKLRENAVEVGSFMLQELKTLQEKYLCVGDVRGVGLMIGVELVEDRETKEPATARAAEIMTHMLVNHDIIMAVDGIHDNVIKIKPPLCFSLENAKHFISSLEAALKNTSH